METTYEYGNQQAAEPFWQRIRKFFLFCSTRPQLRIFGLSGTLLVLVLLPFPADLASHCWRPS
jgi:hypothetical protein